MPVVDQPVYGSLLCKKSFQAIAPDDKRDEHHESQYYKNDEQAHCVATLLLLPHLLQLIPHRLRNRIQVVKLSGTH